MICRAQNGCFRSSEHLGGQLETPLGCGPSAGEKREEELPFVKQRAEPAPGASRAGRSRAPQNGV